MKQAYATTVSGTVASATGTQQHQLTNLQQAAVSNGLQSIDEQSSQQQASQQQLVPLTMQQQQQQQQQQQVTTGVTTQNHHQNSHQHHHSNPFISNTSDQQQQNHHHNQQLQTAQLITNQNVMNHGNNQNNSQICSNNSSSNNNNNNNNGFKKELPANGKKTKGRVRIKMEFIHNKLRRYTTFSKRKTGIMKKAFELATLTGTQVMLLVASETGHVYTFATRKLQPMIISDAGKALIQTCLNSPDSDNLLMSAAAGNASSNGASGSCLNQQQQQQHQQQPSNPSPVSNASPASSSSGSSTSSLNTNANIHQATNSPLSRQLSPNGSNSQAGCLSPNVSTNQAPIGQHSPMSNAGESSPATTATTATNTNMCPLSNADGVQQDASAAANQDQSNVVARGAGQNGVAVQSQQNLMLAVAASTSSSPTDASTAQHQQNTAANDQRMSATGFEETDLSYSINDDLSDRNFNNCLPISMGTISGNAGELMSALQPSAVIVSTPQAFEQTLQSQLDDDNVLSSSDPLLASHSHQTTNQINHHNHQRQNSSCSHHGTMQANCDRHQQNNCRPGQQATATAAASKLNQHQKANSHSIMRNNQVIDIPNFNYNPLYTGLSQQLHDEFEQHQQQNHIHRTSSSSILLNDDEHQFHSSESNDDDNEDILEEIYQLTSSANESHNNSLSRQFNQSRANQSALIQQQQYGNGSRPTQQQQQSSNLFQQMFLNQQSNANESNAPNSRSTNSSRNKRNHAYSLNQLNLLDNNGLDPMPDDCGGLFVEYQTNRNSLGGTSGLEELNSLNVTNCDSETLEEQINLLSSEDCFGPGPNGSQFERGQVEASQLNFNGVQQQSSQQQQQQQQQGSGDNFFNMLFLNSNHSQQQQQIQQQHIQPCYTSSHHNHHQHHQHQSSGDPLSPYVDCLENQLVIDDSSNQQEHLQQNSSTVSSSAMQITENIVTTTNKKKQSTRNKTNHPTNSQLSEKTNCNKKKTTCKTTRSPFLLSPDDKICTKRVPKTPNGQSSVEKQQLHDVPNETWMGTSSLIRNQSTSSSSTSCTNILSADLSPASGSSSSNQQSIDPFEIPYKQQLDNLRKKLKMDAIEPTSSSAAPSSENSKSDKRKQNIASKQPRTKQAQTKSVIVDRRQQKQQQSQHHLQHQHQQQILQHQHQQQQHQQQRFITNRPIQLGRVSTNSTNANTTGGTIFIRTTSGQIVPITSQQHFANHTIHVQQQQVQQHHQLQQHQVLTIANNDQQFNFNNQEQGIVVSPVPRGSLMMHQPPSHSFVHHNCEPVAAKGGQQQSTITVPLLISQEQRANDSHQDGHNYLNYEDKHDLTVTTLGSV